jgi:hypothetical protein
MALTDLPVPVGPSSSVALDGPQIAPAALIRLYSPVEWETFVREWATELEPDYVQIKQLGGPGDKGLDVAAFKTDRQLEGPWDCFQAKHYESPLGFAVAAAEMFKVFTSVIEGFYTLPDTYQFLAPRGLSTPFNLLVSRPEALRERFLGRLSENDTLVKEMNQATLGAVRELAAATDFAMFKSVEVHDAVSTHSRTRWHAARFATALPTRGPDEAPPREYAPLEARYLEQLVEVYAERHPDKIGSLESVAGIPRLSRHLHQQRVRFFRAESLKKYSAGAVPPGTFEKLQDDIHAGVVDIVQADHPDGYTRLGQVLTRARS